MSAMTDSGAGAGRRDETIQWHVATDIATPGWVEVPPPGDNSSQTWPDVAIAEVEEFWQGETGPEIRAEIGRILAAAQQMRAPQEALSLLYWPVQVPAAVGVHVRVLPTVSLARWTEADFDVIRYDGALIGSGAQCVQSAEVAMDGGNGSMPFVSASWVFNQGPDSVVVSVDPVPADWFMHMLGGLQSLLQTLELRRPDGTLFVGEPFDGLARTDIEEWAPLDDFA